MLRESVKSLFDKRLHVKWKQAGEKVHQRVEKRKDSTSGGEKRKKGASEEPKTGEVVHQEPEKRKKGASEEPKTGEQVHQKGLSK